ncbi:MAG: helix-turn-helix transcriptional regulator [Clostridia bacterium]|nr:helix-turn-helix transcriptional regulator [Clostridia bacterium]
MNYTAVRLKRSLEIESVVSIHYFEYTVDFAYPGEAHPFWEIIYCDRGSLKITDNDKTYIISRGQAFLHAPEQYHNVCAAGGKAANSVVFSFFSDCPELYGISGRPLEFDSFSVNTLFSIIREAGASFENPLGYVMDTELKRKPTPALFASEQAIRNYIELLFIHLIRNPKRTGEFDEVPKEERSELLIKRISDYMKEHISEKIIFSDITAQFSISSTTLKKLFKKHYGCGTMEHLTNLRIDTSKELLRSGKYSCTEIASMCGFCSIHHFSKVFKERCDMSPTEYIKTVKSMLEYSEKK